MSKNDHFVRFENVDKSYDGKLLVVKGLNLDIAEGEFVTMLGPSGSGKTTCLMMLAGFETPTNGQIYLDNSVISNIPPHKRGIGMVFQNYALFPHMTVYENLAFPLRVRKIPKDEADKKIDKALSMVSLQGFEAKEKTLNVSRYTKEPEVVVVLRFTRPSLALNVEAPPFAVSSAHKLLSAKR